MSQVDLNQLKEELYGIDFDVSKSIRYHDYRRSFWQTIDRWSKIFTILTGTSVVITIFANNPRASVYLAIAVAVFSASDIVLGFGENFNFHNDLYRKYNKLSRRITRVTGRDISEDKVKELKAERLKIERDELGLIDLLERRCSAEEAVARGIPLDPVWKLNFFEIWISQLAVIPMPRQPKETIKS
jgi:uncharacterized protein YdcH (DUF465 family)